MGKTQPKKLFDKSAVVMAALFALGVALFALTSGERLAHLFKPLFVFLRMASIVSIIGIPTFYIGESLPRSMYDPERFPFKCYVWEKGGQVYEKSLEWYVRGASKGRAEAQYTMGEMYYFGRRVKKDYAKAAEWYAKAAAQGYEPAIQALKELEEAEK